jgi:glutaminase
LVTGGFAAIRDGLGAFAGRPLAIDERVRASEAATGDRNRAIAYLMHGAGSLTCPVEEALDAYFRQCSLLVTVRDLAVMGATLASGGTNPVTGERVVSAEIARHVLTVMATCGMYDFAGEWMLRVGLPAKSGVSGGLVCVLPSQVGVAVFSPPLDSRGNSVRAIAVCEELSGRYGLHMMDRLGPVGRVFSLATTAQALRSGRDRARGERDVLTLAGSAIAIRRVHGDLSFAAAEAVVRAVLADRGGVRWLILDLDRVAAVPPVSARLLEAMAARLADSGTVTVVVDSARRGLLPGGASQCGTLEEALSCCEDALLASEGPGRAQRAVPLADQDLLREMDSGTLRVLAAHLRESQFPDGAELPDVPLCFIVSGHAAAYTTGTTAVGKHAQVASAEPGTAVGRLALGDEGGLPRTWYAAGPLTCYLLTDADLARLADDEPAALEALRWAIARGLAARLRDLSARYQALAG